MPNIRIHAWGGLGSQLFAVALAQDIQQKFPKRRIRMILHTGGVTHRKPEVTSLFPQWTYEFVDDFKKASSSGSSENLTRRIDLATWSRGLIKRVIFGLGIAASCDSNEDFEKVRPWLVFVRGHYSYRTINPFFLSALNHRIHQDLPPLDLTNSCAIHYRLGDLLALKEKGPISSALLVSEFLNLAKGYDFDRLLIFSDSPNEAKSSFELLHNIEVVAPNVATVQVMAYSTDAKFFIGTSSKVSFWISGIRAQVLQKPSLLPSDNLAQFGGIVGLASNLISTYVVNE
jgi:hypothetical protein